MSRRALSTLLLGVTLTSVLVVALRSVETDVSNGAASPSYPRQPITPAPAAADRQAMLPPAIFLPTADAQPLRRKALAHSGPGSMSLLANYSDVPATDAARPRVSLRPADPAESTFSGRFSGASIREPLQVASNGATSGLSLSGPEIQKLPPVDETEELTTVPSAQPSVETNAYGDTSSGIESLPPVTSEEPVAPQPEVSGESRRSTFGMPSDMSAPPLPSESPWSVTPLPEVTSDATPVATPEPVTPVQEYVPVERYEATQSTPSPGAPPAVPQIPLEAMMGQAPTPRTDVLPNPQPVQPTISPRVAQGAMLPVLEQARSMQTRAFSLAQRGAWYTARSEVIESIRLIAQALDAMEGTDQHSASLTAAIVAMKEADEFSPRASRLEGEVAVTSIAQGHRTPVLHGEKQQVPAITAMQMYYSFAQKKLITAGGGYPEAASGMYLLGRVHQAFASQSGDGTRLQLPKAMVYHQAAVQTNPSNHLAANELGVLMARYGQLRIAKDLLVQSVMSKSHVAGWQNLAEVHHRLGEADLAKRADFERETLVRKFEQHPNMAESPVEFISPEAFARQSSQPGADAPTAQTATTGANAVRR